MTLSKDLLYSLPLPCIWKATQALRFPSCWDQPCRRFLMAHKSTQSIAAESEDSWWDSSGGTLAFLSAHCVTWQWTTWQLGHFAQGPKPGTPHKARCTGTSSVFHVPREILPPTGIGKHFYLRHWEAHLPCCPNRSEQKIEVFLGDDSGVQTCVNDIHLANVIGPLTAAIPKKLFPSYRKAF